jgi:hypothetical protein
MLIGSGEGMERYETGTEETEEPTAILGSPPDMIQVHFLRVWVREKYS